MSVILITGSSTGFGYLTAKQLASGGHHIFASMRYSKSTNREHAEALQNFSVEHGFQIEVIDLDVTGEKSLTNGVQTVIDRAGRIDTLINNAGIWEPGVLEAFTMAQWQEVFDVNVFGSVRVARAVLPAMRAQQSGMIIQISSLQGRFILPYSGPYVASNHAIEGAFETFRYEVAPYGVEVCIVEPYDFMTEMKQKAADHQPDDHAREMQYGQQVLDSIQQNYLTPNRERSENPQHVVDAIIKLVNMPVGERPIRTTVKNPLQQIEQINTLAEEMHAQLFNQMGMGYLLRVNTSPR